MKTKLFLAIFAAAALPVAGIAADVSDSQDVQLNKLLAEMNSAPSDQKIVRLLLCKQLVEQRKRSSGTTDAGSRENEGHVHVL